MWGGCAPIVRLKVRVLMRSLKVKIVIFSLSKKMWGVEVRFEGFLCEAGFFKLNTNFLIPRLSLFYDRDESFSKLRSFGFKITVLL